MKTIIFFLTFFSFLTGCASKQTVVAVVSNENIEESQAFESVKDDLLLLQRQEYQLKQQALDSYIEHKLWEDEAKRQGLTKKELHFKIEQVLVSENEIQEFIKAHHFDEKRSAQEKREGAKVLVEMVKARQASKDFLEGLRKKAKVRITLAPLKEDVRNVDGGANPPLGTSEAKVTIVEFGDFECPNCLKGRTIINQLLAKYKKEVRVFYRNFPLKNHPDALPASIAAQCAGEQGKYWEYNNALFDHQDELDDAHFLKQASALDLNMITYQECLKSNKPLALIHKDLQDGSRYGVMGTPTFFINGRIVSGAQPIDALTLVIDDELKLASQKAAQF